ncbi:hypothetical protein BDF21DRAFT_404964 [Thamnidium elegans]|nr:hypothetical protein BDF21DRAFT_404964 [Thamnidium elegans]
MKYLASYIGSGLYTVNVHVADTDTGLYDLIEEAGTYDALKLMKKLDNHRSQRAHLTDGLKTTKLFQVVNAFKGNKKTPCTVKFCETNSSQIIMDSKTRHKVQFILEEMMMVVFTSLTDLYQSLFYLLALFQTIGSETV